MPGTKQNRCPEETACQQRCISCIHIGFFQIIHNTRLPVITKRRLQMKSPHPSKIPSLAPHCRKDQETLLALFHGSFPQNLRQLWLILVNIWAKNFALALTADRSKSSGEVVAGTIFSPNKGMPPLQGQRPSSSHKFQDPETAAP